MSPTFFLYRLLSRFAEVLPSRAITPLSEILATVGVKANPARRALVSSHLGRVMGTEPSPQLVKDSFASYIRYWLDAFRLPVIATDRLEAMFDAEGYEHIEAARSAGHGVVLALPHVGNWDAGGAWLVNRGIPLTVVVEAIEPPELFTWFKNFRQSLGVDVVVSGPDVSKQLLAALGRNEAIALLCDRDVDGTGGDFEFFGEVTKVPKGPALLSLRSGAALLPVAVYEIDQRFHTVIGAPLAAERKGKLSADVDRLTAELVGRMEELIGRAPQQWHLFQPNWPSDHSKHS